MPISLIKEEEAHILRILPILLKKDEQFKNSLYTIFSETFVKKDDFAELKEIVKELAIRVDGLAIRVDGLAITVGELAIRVDGLAITVGELAVAQKRTEQRITRLEKVVEELAIAQKRTEQKIGELAMEVREGFKNLSDRISSIGSRWGVHNEATFRNTIRGIFKHQEGFEVTKGYYGDREIDIVIRNGKHILLEVTAGLKSNDIGKLIQSAEDYKEKIGIEPDLMIASPYISPTVMRDILASHKKIEIFSYEDEDE
ncbi:MAG: DUF3782 domain-containing protein [bacterium]|nr:DUF3782 domain-containing protein [bacterium]